jgi:hypothetical protein
MPSRREPTTAIYADHRASRGRNDNSANHDRHAEVADIHPGAQPAQCYPYPLTATGLAYIRANFHTHTHSATAYCYPPTSSALAHVSFIGTGQSGRSPDH